MLHGNIMMLFMRDCQRGEMLHGNMMLVHEGLPERGNVAR